MTSKRLRSILRSPCFGQDNTACPHKLAIEYGREPDSHVAWIRAHALVTQKYDNFLRGVAIRREALEVGSVR